MATTVLAQSRSSNAASARSPRSEDGAASHRMGYFDKYPARATTSIRNANDNDNNEQPRYTPKPAPASLNGHSSTPPSTSTRKTRTQRSGSAAPDLHIQTGAKFEWPSKPAPSRSSSPDDDESPLTKTSKPASLSSKSRTRNSVASTLPELRYSASTLDRSSFSPPQTPVGTYNHLFSGDNVVVAAPVPGVEMMDAFVDSMNGVAEHSSSDGNDYRLGSSSTSRSRRHREGAKKHLSSLEKRHPGLHPHPPLPKPPQGIKLGTPGKESSILDDVEEPVILRPPRSPRSIRPRVRSSTNSETTPPSPMRSSTDPTIRKGRSSSQLRKPKSMADPEPPSPNPTIDQIIKGALHRGEDPVIPKSSRPSTAPSISDIIRAHAPELAKPKINRPPPILPTSLEETEHDDDDDDRASRSSLDSITHEVRTTIKKVQHSPLHHARSFPTRPTSSAPPTTFGGFRSSIRVSESEYESPLEAPKYARSVYSASSHGYGNTFDGSSFFSAPSTTALPVPGDSAMAVAQYLRSPRLTRLLTLRRPPHRGLQVSLADVGNPNGRPVMVFLGLGCVRYLIALYDEMAEALGLRLIAVDRWGMGRTAEVPQDQRGLKEWAAVCEEVLDTLGIRECGILAHSAGAPYALAFALRLPLRIVGSIHLLAPWVGGGIDAAGYKWLKYVPNSMIKAAQNAEWKVHGWKLGKPPTIVYEGIGFDPKAPVSASNTPPKSSSTGYVPLTADALREIEYTPPSTAQRKTAPTPSPVDEVRLAVPRQSGGGVPRTSMGAWSDYDDLADFEGRFGSQTTLPTNIPPVPPLPEGTQSAPITKRKGSKGIFGKLKGPSPGSTTPPTNNGSTESSAPPAKSSQKIRVLPSISSLKGKIIGQRTNSNPQKSTPKLEPNTDSFGSGLGIELDFKAPSANGIEAWASACSVSAAKPDMPDSRPTSPLSSESHTFPRPRRSVSLTASVAPTLRSLPATITPFQRARSSPVTPRVARPLSAESTSLANSHFVTPPRAVATTSAPTSSVATALLRASHKEAQKGLANDLLSILERDAKPWGFSYTDVRQKVRVWYGDKDEKISEAGIRWMERVMKDCEVKICKGKDHSLMTCAAVVVEALESLQEDLRRG